MQLCNRNTCINCIADCKIQRLPCRIGAKIRISVAKHSAKIARILKGKAKKKRGLIYVYFTISNKVHFIGLL